MVNLIYIFNIILITYVPTITMHIFVCSHLLCYLPIGAIFYWLYPHGRDVTVVSFFGTNFFSLKETFNHFLHFINVQWAKVSFHKYFFKLKFNAYLFGLWVPYIPLNKKYHLYFIHYIRAIIKPYCD
jgi:hypothetical protein